MRKTYGYFFSREGEMWRDSWTYGDWRQYICRRPGGQTQCARFSTFPIFGLMIGVALWTILLLTVGFALFVDLGHRVNGPLLIWFMVVGTLLVLPYILGRLFGVYLMVGVGPMNDGARRVFPRDKKENDR